MLGRLIRFDWARYRILFVVKLGRQSRLLRICRVLLKVCLIRLPILCPFVRLLPANMQKRFLNLWAVVIQFGLSI